MSIMTVSVTHSYRTLMNKSKSDLAHLTLQIMDINAKVSTEADALRERAQHAEFRLASVLIRAVDHKYPDDKPTDSGFYLVKIMPSAFCHWISCYYSHTNDRFHTAGPEPRVLNPLEVEMWRVL